MKLECWSVGVLMHCVFGSESITPALHHANCSKEFVHV